MTAIPWLGTGLSLVSLGVFGAVLVFLHRLDVLTGLFRRAGPGKQD